MKANGFLVALACLAAGCDFTVPLATRPQRPLDKAVVGLWHRSAENGSDETLLVLPLSPEEYLVAYPAGGRDTMYARGCLCRASGLDLVQLEWFGTARGTTPDDKRVYQYVAYRIMGDEIAIRLLNADVVSRKVQSASELKAAIAAASSATNLFRETMTFTRVKER